jgi:dihydroflavonol-4-reductase
VDVEDCATGHLLAAERGVAGERYVLCGAALTLREAVAALRRIWGAPERARFVPAAVARAIGVPAGAVGSLRARATGRSVRICAESVTTLLHGHRYDGSRATRDLGLAYTPLEDTLRRTLAWFAERDLIPPPRLG